MTARIFLWVSQSPCVSLGIPPLDMVVTTACLVPFPGLYPHESYCMSLVGQYLAHYQAPPIFVLWLALGIIHKKQPTKTGEAWERG